MHLERPAPRHDAAETVPGFVDAGYSPASWPRRNLQEHCALPAQWVLRSCTLPSQPTEQIATAVNSEERNKWPFPRHAKSKTTAPAVERDNGAKEGARDR